MDGVGSRPGGRDGKDGHTASWPPALLPGPRGGSVTQFSPVRSCITMKAPEDLARQLAEKANDQLVEMFRRPDDWLPQALSRPFGSDLGRISNFKKNRTAKVCRTTITRPRNAGPEDAPHHQNRQHRKRLTQRPHCGWLTVNIGIDMHTMLDLIQREIQTTACYPQNFSNDGQRFAGWYLRR